MSHHKATVLTGLLLLCVATASWACSCTRRTPREHVCASAYAIKVSINWKSSYTERLRFDYNTTDTIPYEGYLYGGIISRVLKSPPNIDSFDLEDLTLFIPSQDNLCGRILERDHTYIITGDIAVWSDFVAAISTTDICNYIVDVSMKDPETIREVTELLNTSDFRCDEERPDDDDTSHVARTLRNLWGIEQ